MPTFTWFNCTTAGVDLLECITTRYSWDPYWMHGSTLRPQAQSATYCCNLFHNHRMAVPRPRLQICIEIETSRGAIRCYKMKVGRHCLVL